MSPTELSTADDPWPSLGDVTTVLCDLDGVVWLAHEAIDGAPEAVRLLRSGGRRVLFVTNNSLSTMAEHEAALAAIGIDATHDGVGDVVSSAQAAAMLVSPGERALLCAGPGVAEALAARGATPVHEPPCDVVVVGLHRDFDYERLRIAARAVRDGARLVGTNDDATFPTPDGPIPGGGAILAAVSTAAGAAPVVAGKPHRPMAELVRARCGTGFDPRRTIMVGDRPSTDGAFAHELGCRFALVRTGVTPAGAPAPVGTHLDADDLAAVASSILGRPVAR